MPPAKTTLKDLEIRLALNEQGFSDIKKRLDHIDNRLATLTSHIDKGIGSWKGIVSIGTLLGVLLSFLKLAAITAHQ